MPSLANRSILTATKGTAVATAMAAVTGIAVMAALYVVPSWSKVTHWLMMFNARWGGSVGEPDPFTGQAEIEYGIISYGLSVFLWLLVCAFVACLPALAIMKLGPHKPD